MSDRPTPPTCGGHPMDYNVMKRMWECACGRDVADESRDSAVALDAFDHVAEFRTVPPRVVDLAGGRSPFPAAAHKSCPRCHTLWEVSGFAWQFECKCRRWTIGVTGRESWQPIPGAPEYCCGREMERAITARQYECVCGRTVPDEIALTVDPGPGTDGGAWLDPWPSAAGRPMHALSVPIAAPLCHCAPPIDPGAFGFAEHHAIIGDHPTDAEIVERMESHLRYDESFGRLIIRGHRIDKAEQSTAWSRLLAAKVAASDAARTEAARRVVLGPIDDESEA